MNDRKSAKSVDYMELPGARKDADCRIVEVPGGVSSRLGCCNDFELGEGQQKQFRCGTCKYLIPAKTDHFFGESVAGNSSRDRAR